MENLISNKLKSQLTKIAWITIAWTIFSVFQFMTGYQALLGMNCDLSDKDPVLYIKGSILTGIIAGLLGGSGMVFLWEGWLRNKSYGWTLLNIFFSYTIIYLVVSFSTGVYMYGQHLGLPLWNTQVMVAAIKEIMELAEWQNYLVWLVVVLGTLVFLQVNDKYGPGTFLKLLKGKYFHPRREERIFMFLDLKSSTTIAEKLQEEKYFNFINDVFKHSTPPILNSRGEIYQYVGDEIVVSWPVDQGIKNENCVNCFFDIQKVLKDKSAYYKARYGAIPHFKAGLHYGYVMAGEIGLVKRDIAFSGDVLNTTSRIQEKCNELGVNILISHFLIEKLRPIIKKYAPTKIGDMHLRGKQKEVRLFTV